MLPNARMPTVTLVAGILLWQDNKKAAVWQLSEVLIFDCNVQYGNSNI
jgi:hypothetical protein